MIAVHVVPAVERVPRLRAHVQGAIACNLPIEQKVICICLKARPRAATFSPPCATHPISTAPARCPYINKLVHYHGPPLGCRELRTRPCRRGANAGANVACKVQKRRKSSTKN